MKKKKIKKYRIIATEDSEMNRISIVDKPAIEVNAMLFNKQLDEYKFKISNKDKMELMGPAMIPDKPMIRFEDKEPYFVEFSKEDIEQYLLKFQKRNSDLKINFNHSNKMVSAFVKEIWIKESEEDKSNKYYSELPIGTLFMKVKIEDEIFWEKEVKTEGFKGFSVEVSGELEEIGEEEYQFSKFNFRYDDYPQVVKDNAQRAIDNNLELGNKCATQVGKIRAQQLVNGENLSLETIKRTYSYLSRAKEYDNNDWKSCGTISYNLWGGDEMLRWTERKITEIEEFCFEDDEKTKYLNKCIPKLIEEGKDQDQSIAICISKWEDKNVLFELKKILKEEMVKEHFRNQKLHTNCKCEYNRQQEWILQPDACQVCKDAKDEFDSI